MILGLAIFVAYLYFFVGFGPILTVLKRVNSTQYALFYTLALLAVVGSVFFWSAAWNHILQGLDIRIPYRRSYLYYWVSYFTDLVIPCATICGELTRLYLVQRETKENFGALGSVAVTNRIVAYTVVTIGLYTGAALLFLKHGVPAIISNIFITFVVSITIYMGVLFYLAFDKFAARNIARLYLKIVRTFRPKHYRANQEEDTRRSLEDYYRGFRTFREKPSLLIKPFILHSVSYMMGLASYVLVFYALGIPSSSFVFYIVVFFITTAFQDATASFSVGSLEIFLATIFVLYGINPAVSGIAAVVLRSAIFWFPLLVGFLCVQIIGAENLLAARPEEMRKLKEQEELKKREEYKEADEAKDQ